MFLAVNQSSRKSMGSENLYSLDLRENYFISDKTQSVLFSNKTVKAKRFTCKDVNCPMKRHLFIDHVIINNII